MTKRDWLDLAVLARKQYNCLSEVWDLSQQLGEAMDRNDSVSVRMLIGMLQELQQAVGLRKESLSPEGRERVTALDQGAAPQGEEETTYFNQTGSARRLLERIIQLDERLNRRMGGKDSFYVQEK